MLSYETIATIAAIEREFGNARVLPPSQRAGYMLQGTPPGTVAVEADLRVPIRAFVIDSAGVILAIWEKETA